MLYSESDDACVICSSIKVVRLPSFLLLVFLSASYFFLLILQAQDDPKHVLSHDKLFDGINTYPHQMIFD